MPRAETFAVDVSQLLALADGFDASIRKVAVGTITAVKETAEVAETVAKAHVPVDTGDLRDSINIKIVGAGGLAGVRAVVRAGMFYGWFVEAGTARQAPQPFMEPAAKVADRTLPAKLEQVIEEATR